MKPEKRYDPSTSILTDSNHSYTCPLCWQAIGDDNEKLVGQTDDWYLIRSENYNGKRLRHRLLLVPKAHLSDFETIAQRYVYPVQIVFLLAAAEKACRRSNKTCKTTITFYSNDTASRHFYLELLIRSL